jgi:serine/threonine-protein kinase HipA
VSQPGAISLSLSLPEPFEEAVARPFFDNLLQERDGALSDIMAREGIARDDIASLLFHLGKDCAGALSVLPAGSPPTKVPGDCQEDYQRLEDDRLIAIVDSLHKRRRLPAGTDDLSPLAGMQSKTALTLLPEGSLAGPLPGSGAPTTHILKVPDQEHIHDGSLEYEAMRLSHAVGFSTADVSLLPLAGIEVLLVTVNETGITVFEFSQKGKICVASSWNVRWIGDGNFDVSRPFRCRCGVSGGTSCVGRQKRSSWQGMPT